MAFVYMYHLSSICSLLMDGFQMSTKHLTSGGHMRDQEAAVQQTFHLERTGFFYLSALAGGKDVM